MILFMRRNARGLGGDPRSSAAGALAAGSAASLVAMTFLAVMREGLQTAMFLLAAAQASVGVPRAGPGWAPSQAR
jgi:high-affinity iron transporter